jgi:predicted MFS family arabinose efflux permease
MASNTSVVTEKGDETPGQGSNAQDFGSSRIYACYVLVLLMAANLLSYADRHLFSVLMPAIKDEFDLSDTMLGFIAGPAFIIPFVLLSLPLASLADRWSRRKVLALSVTIWSAATAACGFASNSLHLIMARVMVGTGEAGGFPAAQAIIADIFPPQSRSSALGVFSTGTYFGLLAGLAGGGALAASVGWRETFMILAAPGVLVALLIWLTGPKRVASPDRPSIPMIQAIRLTWSSGTFRALSAGMTLFTIYGFAAAVWIPSYFVRSHGMSITEAGIWLGVGAGIGGILGSFSSGFIVDRLIARDMRWRLWIPTVGFLLAIPFSVTLLVLPKGYNIHIGALEVPWVGILIAISAYLNALWSAPSYAALFECVSAEIRSQVSALLIAIISVAGATIGPLIIGIASDTLTARFGAEALRYSMLGVTSINLFVVLLFWRAARTYKDELALRGSRENSM